jgi:tetratricopeptide (TPR) repeat protein
MELLDEAIPVLRRAIQLDHTRAEGYYNLGLVYRRKGQADLAIQAYREATRVNPRMADAHFNLANLYFEKGQYGQATNHYRQALETRPNWDKAMSGLEQAEEAHAAAVKEIVQSRAPKTAPVAKPAFDPYRQVDPLVQGGLLSILHKATIESDSQGRHFLQILEDEIEPAIKELSSCLLYPDVSASELDHCVQKFEDAIANMRSAQRHLQSSMERVRTVGEQLLKT